MASTSSHLARYTTGRLSAAPSLLSKGLQCECGRAAQPYSTASTSTLGENAAPSSSTTTATSSSSPYERTPTTHYRITLRRSAIGLPEHRTLVLESLGLKKRLSSVYMRQDPTAAGKILKIKELVAVQNVRRASESEARWVKEKWEDRMRTGLHVNALAALAGAADVSAAAAGAVVEKGQGEEEDNDVWIDENGFVVDAGRTGKQAPRGYRVVGNVLDGSADQISL
ncbi:unnamed protein product [Tilletia caries]|nr:unnamed protein product [Tilletia caries]CAD6984684.1 unnamed protein product [Tilletia controversa]